MPECPVQAQVLLKRLLLALDATPGNQHREHSGHFQGQKDSLVWFRQKREGLVLTIKLEVELPDSSVVAGWCNAPVCAQRLDNGTRLPADQVGRRARIELRQQQVFIGTEEDRMEAEELRGITLLSRK